jgi:large-conductance mechanosensitive channel
MDKVKNTLKDYVGVLTNNNILGFAIAMMLANSVIEFSNVTIESIVMPTLDPYITKNKNYNVKLGNIQINLDKFIRSLLKLFVLTLIIFLLFKYIKKISLSSSIGITQIQQQS